MDLVVKDYYITDREIKLRDYIQINILDDFHNWFKYIKTKDLLY